MASGEVEELDKHPAPFKLPVWEYSGFPVNYNDERRALNKTVSVSPTWHNKSPMNTVIYQAWPPI